MNSAIRTRFASPMTRAVRVGLGVSVLVTSLWLGSWAGAAPSGEAFFVREVKPLLTSKCISCHSGEKPQGGLRLSSRDQLLKGGTSGPAVDLKRPDASLLLSAINYKGRRMPPQGQMSAAQIGVFTRWVREGMSWPGGEHASLEPKVTHGPPQVNAQTRAFWSFQPVKRPAVPQVRYQEWVRTPLDAFVLARLEKEGLKPSPAASRATLIRRATYDLTGLPPSPEQVAAFVQDRSADAWPRLVDRLLDSPQYGERWGRHWLDLVRFAESNSYERDGNKPFAWRYRDYVINAFNQDKPYNRFIVEQLAGDELSPRTSEGLIATGYHRLGIWDDEPVDSLQAHYDDLDDIVSTTGQVFLGLTVGCARCHDHKIDPMPQKDYYRFLAFFNGLNRFGIRGDDTVERFSLRPLAFDVDQQKWRREVDAHREAVRVNEEAVRQIERKLRPQLTPVEREDFVTVTARPDIARKYVGTVLTQAEHDQYAALLTRKQQLRTSAPPALEQALCVTEIGPKPRETFVLLRGNPHVKGEAVEPGFFSVLSPPSPTFEPSGNPETSGRRTALARWISDPANPLTARVMANRVFQYHFGRGLVRSSNDFGFAGTKPTHPELLDWLAADLVEGGWTLKRLHRLIMTSSAYQMSSAGNPAALAKDPQNELLWRFDMRRLSAEELRDSILAANGSLNLKAGGPSMYPTIPAEVLAGQSRPGENWGNSSEEEQRRRSVYIFVKRSLMTPILAAFDAPEPDFTCPVRFTSTQPTQALGMLNSKFLADQAGVLARFAESRAGADPRRQVEFILSRVLQRPPSPTEVGRGVALLETFQREDRVAPAEALRIYGLMALNLNEFIYLD